MSARENCLIRKYSTKKPKALLLAKTGYVIRDILLGEFTEELIKEMDLIVAVPDPDDKNLKIFRDNPAIELIQFHFLESPIGRYAQFFSLQHWMYRFKQVEIKNASFDIQTKRLEPNLSGKRKLLVQLMQNLAGIINALNLMALAEALYLFLIARWGITCKWTEILKELKPDIVISTVLTLPDGMFAPSVDLPVLLAAKQLNIPSGTLVQSWDNLTSKPCVLPSWISRYWVWSQAMRDELLHYNPRVNKETVKVVGSPHYDFHHLKEIRIPRDHFLKTLGLDPERPYLLIATGTTGWLPDEPIRVLRLVRRLRETNPALQVLLRMHPKDDELRWPDHMQDLRDLGVVIQKPIPDRPMDQGGFTPPRIFFSEQINTIFHAAVVVNTASSITVDAAILDRPVISIGYDLMPDCHFPEGRSRIFNRSAHFKPLFDSGGVWVVESDDECIEAINQYLADPALHRRERTHIVELVAGCTDGHSGRRLAQEVSCLFRK